MGNAVVEWSDTGANMFDSYRTGDRVFVLDDVNRNSISRDNLLALTDNSINKKLSARYQNKNVYFLELVIITSLYSPDDYFKLIKNQNDPLDQLLGRIDLIVRADDNNEIDGEEWKYRIYERTSEGRELLTNYFPLQSSFGSKYDFKYLETKKIPKDAGTSAGIDDKLKRAKNALQIID